MRISFLFILPFICMHFTSCQPLLKGYYGISTPKPVDDEHIIEHQRKWFAEKDSDAYFVKFEAYKQLMNELDGIPAIKVFDNQGQQITYLDDGESSCSGRAAEFIASLSPDSTYNNIPGITLSDVLSRLEPINAEKADSSGSKSADFYIVAYWASFAGKLNRKVIYEPLSNHYKNDKITLILANCDVRKGWGKPKLRELGF